MTLPEDLQALLNRCRHDPSAYKSLRYEDFGRKRLRNVTSSANQGTNAWRPEAPRTLPQKPASMFALGSDKVRSLVRDDRLRHAVAGWDGGSLLLCGPTGAGKTAALVLLCLDKSPSGMKWVDGYALGQSARRHALGQGEPELIGMACRASVLILDDPDHAQDREPFIEVMRYRYDSQSPTLVATGKSEADFEQWAGSAYFRRIQESGASCSVVDLWRTT